MSVSVTSCSDWRLLETVWLERSLTHLAARSCPLPAEARDWLTGHRWPKTAKVVTSVVVQLLGLSSLSSPARPPLCSTDGAERWATDRSIDHSLICYRQKEISRENAALRYTPSRWRCSHPGSRAAVTAVITGDGPASSLSSTERWRSWLT